MPCRNRKRRVGVRASISNTPHQEYGAVQKFRRMLLGNCQLKGSALGKHPISPVPFLSLSRCPRSRTNDPLTPYFFVVIKRISTCPVEAICIKMSQALRTRDLGIYKHLHTARPGCNHVIPSRNEQDGAKCRCPLGRARTAS